MLIVATFLVTVKCKLTQFNVVNYYFNVFYSKEYVLSFISFILLSFFFAIANNVQSTLSYREVLTIVMACFAECHGTNT